MLVGITDFGDSLISSPSRASGGHDHLRRESVSVITKHVLNWGGKGAFTSTSFLPALLCVGRNYTSVGTYIQACKAPRSRLCGK